MERKVIFRGQVVRIVERRVPLESRNPNCHYYNLIHTDRDYHFPFFISEIEGLINWFGYIVSDTPLSTSKSNWIKLKPHERIALASGSLEEQIKDLLISMEGQNFKKMHEVVEDRVQDFSDIDDCYVIGPEAYYRKGFENDLSAAATHLNKMIEMKRTLF
ncbi:hypothetical protein [Bacillus sp. FJAT-28004]|uniref:hypothetical protein n=1 Tax=Bacillus sp. FJAT-28004 TaxID=1679165 RepID=UPI0006B45521|nr:hypothetical protein [Bacillus sp. FJAT-28004]